MNIITIKYLSFMFVNLFFDYSSSAILSINFSCSFSCTTLFSIPWTFQTVSDIPWDVCAFFLQASFHLFSSFCKFIKNWIKPDSDLFFFTLRKTNCQASLSYGKNERINWYLNNNVLYHLHLNYLLYVERISIAMSVLFSLTKMPTFLNTGFLISEMRLMLSFCGAVKKSMKHLGSTWLVWQVFSK